jgi:integrase
MSVHQTKDGRWFATWRDDGKQRKRVFGRWDLAHRQALKWDEDSRIKKGRNRTFHGPSIDTLCQTCHRSHQREVSTADTDAYRLARVILPMLGRHEAETLHHKVLHDFVADRLADGKARRTIEREISLLKAIYSWAERQEPPLISRNPIAKYKLSWKKESRVPLPPTPGELGAILGHSPEHLRRALILCWHLGCRPGGEVSRITWQDVDLHRQLIRIHSAHKGGPETRLVPFSGLLGHLLQWRTTDMSAFGAGIAAISVVHYRGKSVVSLKHSWSTAKIKAGVTRPLRLYDIRHAFATMALAAGEDLKALSEILGHSQPDTTIRHYQHVTRDQHRAVVAAIPDLPVSGRFGHP